VGNCSEASYGFYVELSFSGYHLSSTHSQKNLMNTPPSHSKGSSLEAFPNTRELITNPELAQYWLSAIVESADDAIISKTLEGIITSWNKGAQNLFGYTEEEAVGRPVLMLIPADHQNEEPGILARLRFFDSLAHQRRTRNHYRRF
jgi:PAS domain-containing protein